MYDLKTTRLYWHKPTDTKPVGLQTILVVYENQVWPAVYAAGNVSRYPEDFPPVRFEDCAWWAALPSAEALK